MEDDGLDRTRVVNNRAKEWAAKKLAALGIPPATKNEMGCTTLPPRPFIEMLAFPPKPNGKLREAFERHAREVESR